MKSFIKVNEYITKEWAKSMEIAHNDSGLHGWWGVLKKVNFTCALSSQSFIASYCLRRVGMNGQVLRSATIPEKIVPTQVFILLPSAFCIAIIMSVWPDNKTSGRNIVKRQVGVSQTVGP
jgi:hypothetical protein